MTLAAVLLCAHSSLPAQEAELTPGAAEEPEPVTPAVEAWVQDHALPVSVGGLGLEDTDLEALDLDLTDVRIVALGEATHGTREIFQIKSRLIRHLITEHGFTELFFETHYHDGLAIDAYIQGGPGTAEEALEELGFWTWQTEEVRDLIEWLRTWNQSAEQPVRFYGADMQYLDEAAHEALDFLAHCGSDEAEKLSKAFTAFIGPDAPNPYRLEDEDKQALRMLTDRLLAAVSQVEETDHESCSGAVRQSAEMSAFVAERFSTMIHPDPEIVETYNNPTRVIRDPAMADMVLTFLDQADPEARGILWAHNNHIQETPITGEPIQGQVLNDALGEEAYLSIGFAFGQGGFQAFFTDWIGEPEEPSPDGSRRPRFRSFDVGPPPLEAFEAPFMTLLSKAAYLDLRELPPDGPVHDWFSQRRSFRTIGAVYDHRIEWHGAFRDMSALYDSVLFIRDTSRARPLPNIIDRFGIEPDWSSEQ